MRGSSDCAQAPLCVSRVCVVFEPFAWVKKVAVLVQQEWKAASWRTVTGCDVLSRCQYGARTSSPSVSTRPWLLS